MATQGDDPRPGRPGFNSPPLQTAQGQATGPDPQNKISPISETSSNRGWSFTNYIFGSPKPKNDGDEQPKTDKLPEVSEQPSNDNFDEDQEPEWFNELKPASRELARLLLKQRAHERHIYNVLLKDPTSLMDKLQEHYKFKLKGVGPISFHLGCDFERDPDGTLKYTPKKYIAKMMETYQRHFGELPKEVTSVLPKGDHPELDDSPLCDPNQQAIYLSMVGCMQWLITLGRIDIHYAVTTMSSYRPAPRVGHLERVKRIYGYIRKFKDAAIRVRTEQPDYSQLPNNEHDWLYTVYEGAKELVPNDAPAPLGKEVVTTTYFDANLYANLITGRAMTGIIHLLNKTPLESYSKAQSVVAAATFGSEFIAARLSMEQIYAMGRLPKSQVQGKEDVSESYQEIGGIELRLVRIRPTRIDLSN